MKKKIIIIAIAIVLVVGAVLFSIFKSSGKEENINTKITEKTTAYITDLEDSSSTLTNNEKIYDYLCNWAKSKGVKYTTDNNDNVIMSVKSSSSYKAAAPTVIVCTYDSQQLETCISPMATALYTVKNNESTGKLTVIFTPSKGNDFSGIKKINSKYFPDSANVFTLNGGEQAKFSLKTGGMSTYTLTNKLQKTTPSGTKAIKIRIQGLPGGTPDGKISSYPNPIKMLSDLLAYFKTNAYIYELGSFFGGSSSGVYPRSATMTIVVSTDTLDKFTGRLDSEIEDFNDNYLEKYPDATYTYKETTLPESVFTEKSNNSFVSLMYTLESGVYFRDDDDNLVSITNIGSVSNIDSSIAIKVMANSLSDNSLNEINTSHKTICGLSNAKYSKNDTINSWESKNEDAFNEAVSNAFNEYSGKTMEYSDQVAATSANYVYSKNKKCNIMNVTLYEEKVERYVGTIITFLLNQTHDQ